jgi:AcrR family transcriptional regulator
VAAPTERRDVRAALLQAAELELIEHGADQVSLRAIARRAGVSHQAPAHFFGNRAGLFTALAAHELAVIRAGFEAAVARTADRSARDRLSATGLSYIQFADERHELFSLAVRGGMLDAENEALVRERTLTWSSFVNCVAEAQAEGWRRDQPLEDVALMCWVIVHGTATAWADGLLSLQYPNRTLDEIARTVVDGL